MSRPERGAVPALGFGLGFLLAGGALLLQDMDLLTLRWTFVLPLILLAVGAVVLLSAFLAAVRDARNGEGQR